MLLKIPVIGIYLCNLWLKTSFSMLKRISCRVSKKQVIYILLLFGLIGVYAAGLTIRREVLRAQMEYIGDDMPFTLESALHFRRVKMMYDRGFLPEIDEAVQYPEGIRIREIDSVSSEPVQAFLAGLFPESVPFAARIRWIEAGWFCLSLPLLVWLMRTWTGSWSAGWVTGLLYAVSLASVLRTTGQEISRENFAFPFLIATYVSAVLSINAGSPVRQWWWGMAVGLFTALSLIAWDMSQYLLGIAALGMVIHLLVHGERLNPRVKFIFGFITVAVILTGLLHPYHRHHGLAFSPMTLWLVSIWAAGVFFLTGRPKAGACRRWLYPLLIMFGPVGLLLAAGLTGAYGASYEHFAELIIAKIRFMNIKPDDPSLMTYYQRIMWVPSLHSATWGLTKWLFPFTVWLSGLIALIAWVITWKRPDPLINHWILLFVISVLAYILFVRFHVFVVLSSAVLAGWACGKLRHVGIGWQAPVVFIMMLAIMAEGMHTLRQRYVMGRPNVYYEELKELADWLKDRIAPSPVLANMGVSAYVAAYGKCPIVIHPKFEDPTIRERLFQYGTLLFGEDEKALRDWMDDLGVEYYIYSKGEFSREKPELQMRYFVNRMNPPDSAPARRFEREDDTLRYFSRQWGNRKYVVYKAMSRNMERSAQGAADQAMEYLQVGNLDEAEQMAVEALTVDRMHEKALQVIRHAGSLREQGFRSEPATAAP